MIRVNLRVYDRRYPFGWGVAVALDRVRFWLVRMDEGAPVLAASEGDGTEEEHRAAVLDELREHYSGDWLFEVKED